MATDDSNTSGTKRAFELAGLETGVPGMDEQHLKLFSLLEEARRFTEMPDPHDRGEAILAAILDYTKYHFLYEETLMKDFDYPGLREHQHEHNSFTSKIIHLFDMHELEQEDPSLTMSNIVRTLTAWLNAHIKDNDRELGSFITAR